MESCPNCGSDVGELLAVAPVAVCPYCSTTLYRLDNRLLSSGSAGEMHDAPNLLRLGDRVLVGEIWFTAVGHARFSYGPGWWDEFWLDGPSHEGAWLSIDEGDVTIQFGIDPPAGAPLVPRIGDEIEHKGTTYTVSEEDEGRCLALRGVFPERLAVGDVYRYANATAHDGRLLSCEGSADGRAWFEGAWLNPFELKVERA